ncbi:MAG: response regulator [Candidatus Dadabacteria bacterium]|nr:MAG: response regulator [Candidatus Dadabacteria bacterium]
MAKILVVEDEDEVRSMLREVLTRAGYVVLEAVDGEEGLQAFREHRPDVLITDLLMPVRGGLSLIVEVRQIDPRARILAISGGGPRGNLNFLDTARALGDVETLRKPFRRSALLSALERLVGQGG